jgi:diguanylate cyclase (GGDEF)-like protein
MVDDDENDWIVVSRWLSSTYRPCYAASWQELKNILNEELPICILLDYHMGSKNGAEILRGIKQFEIGQQIPVVMVTAEKNYRVVVECMKEGAYDYLVKEDYTKERVLEVIADAVRERDREKQLEQEQAETKKLATTDELTGVWNRHSLLKQLKNKIENQQHSKEFTKLTIVLFDIDGFKSINDTHGHLAGDAILQQLTDFIQSQIRDYDLIGRYGGDEFVIVLNQKSKNNCFDFLQQACLKLDNIRQQIAQQAMVLPNSDTTIQVSLSLGVAAFFGQPTTVAEILSQADKALYHAKQNGRNRVAYDFQGQLYLY